MFQNATYCLTSNSFVRHSTLLYQANRSDYQLKPMARPASNQHAVFSAKITIILS